MTELGISALRRLATPMWDSGESEGEKKKKRKKKERKEKKSKQLSVNEK